MPSLVQPLEQVEHLRRRLRVEVAGRLVADQQRRVGRERARDRHALLLAARQLGRQVVELVAEPDQLEVSRAFAPLALRSRRAKSSGSIAFSSAVSVGSSWKNWNTMPTLRPRQTASCSSFSGRAAGRRP